MACTDSRHCVELPILDEISCNSTGACVIPQEDSSHAYDHIVTNLSADECADPSKGMCDQPCGFGCRSSIDETINGGICFDITQNGTTCMSDYGGVWSATMEVCYFPSISNRSSCIANSKMWGDCTSLTLDECFACQSEYECTQTFMGCFVKNLPCTSEAECIDNGGWCAGQEPLFSIPTLYDRRHELGGCVFPKGTGLNPGIYS
jgi:hypothetical protein